MSLADTKERALPHPRTATIEDHLVFLKHLALYEFAKDFAARRRVLDLGCGEGYGANELAQIASSVIAADYSVDAIAHARRTYAHPHLLFVVCDAQQLPFRDQAFETTISFEVIEHIQDVRAYLQEIKRVCDKRVVISTPNRSFRLLPFQRPWNRYHRREYDHGGLARLLGQVFANVEMRGIAAIPEVMKIEKQRVKEKPWIAYPRMFAQMLLPYGLYEMIKRLISKGSTPNHASPEIDTFSAADFTILEDNLKECINLVAICNS